MTPLTKSVSKLSYEFENAIKLNESGLVITNE